MRAYSREVIAETPRYRLEADSWGQSVLVRREDAKSLLLGAGDTIEMQSEFESGSVERFEALADEYSTEVDGWSDQE